MVLHLSLQLANLILQLPARPLERVVDGERQVGMPLVGLRGAVDIDLPAVRKRQTDVDLVESTRLVMTPLVLSARPGKRSHDHNAARVRPHARRWPCGVPASRPCLENRFRPLFAYSHSNVCTGNASSALHRHFRFGVTFLVVLGDFRHRGFRHQQDAGD